MEVVISIVGVCFVLLMLLLVAWVVQLEERVRRLETPRAWLGEKEMPVIESGGPARRRSSGAE